MAIHPTRAEFCRLAAHYNALEGANRGPYAGAVGYIDFCGNMDTCITIRTMVVEAGKVSVQAGAGIVYDSEPEREYAETLHKARALMKVIAGEGGNIGGHH